MIRIFYLGLFFLYQGALSQEIDISTGWRFHTGDSMHWGSPEYNDQHWDTLQVGKQWEDQHIAHDGIGWYRKHVFIPSAYKANYQKYGLSAILGSIDDCDQAFFNDSLIGNTGNMAERDNNAYYYFRNYTIPLSLVKWDQLNVLSVRVMDWYGGGGMYRGPYLLTNHTPDSLYKIKPELIQSGKNFSVRLQFENVKSELKGTIEYYKVNLYSNTRLDSFSHNLRLKPKDFQSIEHNFISTDENICLVYKLHFEGYGHTKEGRIFVKSSFFADFQWSGQRFEYPGQLSALEKAENDLHPDLPAHVNGDTYPCTWGDNDNIYMSAGDPDFPWGNPKTEWMSKK